MYFRALGSGFITVETAKYVAIVKTRINRAIWSACLSFVCDMPKPLDLKAENEVSPTSCHNRVSEPVWRTVHGDNPQLFMAFFLQHPDRGNSGRAVHLCVYDPFRGKVRNLSCDNLCASMMQPENSDRPAMQTCSITCECRAIPPRIIRSMINTSKLQHEIDRGILNQTLFRQVARFTDRYPLFLEPDWARRPVGFLTLIARIV